MDRYIYKIIKTRLKIETYSDKLIDSAILTILLNSKNPQEHIDTTFGNKHENNHGITPSSISREPGFDHYKTARNSMVTSGVALLGIATISNTIRHSNLKVPKEKLNFAGYESLCLSFVAFGLALRCHQKYKKSYLKSLENLYNDNDIEDGGGQNSESKSKR
jgi:hypothetical protein